MPVKIRVYIYSCRNLPVADDNGSSDPYVRVWDTSEEVKKTKIIY
jgi:Ca2+-dependent lipid-binding protein